MIASNPKKKKKIQNNNDFPITEDGKFVFEDKNNKKLKKKK